MTDSPIRIVIPIDVLDDDEVPAAAGLVTAQRADWHVDMPDVDLTALAARSVHPRRSLWHRIVTRIGGAR